MSYRSSLELCDDVIVILFNRPGRHVGDIAQRLGEQHALLTLQY